MFKFIKDYFKKRKQIKAYKIIEKELLGNPKMLLDQQNKFEKQFGKDNKTRTAKQWSNLVRVYGIETVVLKERMTKAQVEMRCKESWGDRFKRETKLKAV
jgi:hypothetical protein